MSFKLSEKSINKLEGVHEDLARVVKRAIEITSVDFMVTSGLRTLCEQKELYARGRRGIEGEKIVTWTMASSHLSGKAVDLGVVINGKYVNGDTKDELALYGLVANAMLKAAAELQVPLIWGGSWTKNPDAAHFELNRKFY